MEPEDKPRNVYDDPQFFAGYGQLDRFQNGWGGGMEHATFLELLGDVSGRRVLDLGCGGGQLTSHLANAGAAEVLGIDASERMLEAARSRFAHARVTYRKAAMEEVEFSAGEFDMVVSSLAFHYVRDYEGLLRRVARWLVAGGPLVFSTEHPIYTSRSTAGGWVVGPEGTCQGWAIDRYAEEGPREHRWFVDGVRRYHRTLATLINGLVDAGFVVERVVETAPSETWLQTHLDHADESRRPMFLLVSVRKA